MAVDGIVGRVTAGAAIRAFHHHRALVGAAAEAARVRDNFADHHHAAAAAEADSLLPFRACSAAAPSNLAAAVATAAWSLDRDLEQAPDTAFAVARGNYAAARTASSPR